MKNNRTFQHLHFFQDFQIFQITKNKKKTRQNQKSRNNQTHQQQNKKQIKEHPTTQFFISFQIFRHNHKFPNLNSQENQQMRFRCVLCSFPKK